MNNTITDVPGLKVGHAHSLEGITGCTVILTEGGAAGGVDQRGGAPGTRETDLLRPMHLVEEVHAILLGGGSAYGLDAASGVMRWLEEQGTGYNTGVAKVPIVPSAILFDLGIGDASIRPDAAMGWEACKNASDGPVAQGCVGAGTGATVGSMFGANFEVKSGIGSASIDLGGGVMVGALIAVNAFGDVIDPESNQLIAGALKPPQGKVFADTLESMRGLIGKTIMRFTGRNTVIGVVAANANLSKEAANKVAQMAHNGLARTIRPAHTYFDGDTIFALGTGGKNVDVNVIGAYAAEAVVQAVLNGVRAATALGGRPAPSEFANVGP